ncbi:MAG: N-succinylarginine dihydrolase [Casimicrobiaceae bacterium]
MTEVNFDGLPGPTHNYSGLARGNLASENNAQLAANPRAAALQGIAKMRVLAARGHAQAVLPPHERPHVPALRTLGFSGSDQQVIANAAAAAPTLLAACSSASAMWTANAATVSPSADTADARVHLTPANLVAHFHRALEAPVTTRVLRAIFSDDRHFVVHDPLPAAPQFGDEGAANHTRLASGHGSVELFVYGRHGFASGAQPSRFTARQTLDAQQAIARRHGLDSARTLFAQQNPAVVDQGVFHNDVIAVGAGNVLFCHAQAYVGQPALLARLHEIIADLNPIVVEESDVSVQQAVATYLFNSQLLKRADGRLLLVAPAECREHAHTSAYLDRLLAQHGPIAEVMTFDLRQSMRNGGGPACLRLRVELTAAERASVAARVFVDAPLCDALERIVLRNYRDRLLPADLADPALLDESRRALDEISTLLAIGNVYDFQR